LLEIKRRTPARVYGEKGEGIEMAIRDEVGEMSAKLSALVLTLADDVPNKEEITTIVEELFGLVTESIDFAQIPKEERAKAILTAVIGAGNFVASKMIKFSDE